MISAQRPVNVTAVLDTKSYDEALYIEGKLAVAQPTIFMHELAREVKGMPFILEHIEVECRPRCFPASLHELLSMQSEVNGDKEKGQ